MELIDREAAIDAIVKHSYAVRYDYNFTSIENGMTVTGIKQVLDELPSAQPETHYCRECKWSRCHISVDKHGETETYWHCLNWDGGTDDEGFCYKWERRTDE